MSEDPYREVGMDHPSDPAIPVVEMVKSIIPERVDHPPHYNAHPSGVEAITICEHYNFNLGNVIKYVWRAGQKGELLEDLKKAKWYLDREIQRLEKTG